MMQKTTDAVTPPASHILIIEPGRAERHYWRDLWECRELLYFLALRDLSVRYRQTLLGVAWVIVRPLLTMIVFSVVFGRIAGLSSGAAPYPVMVFAALLAWQLFVGVLTDSGNSIVGNGSMVSKVYFPRMIIPMSSMLVNLVDFLVSALLFAALMAWYGVTPNWHFLILPLFIVLALVISIGAGLWVAALNVRYRDFRFILSFAVQLGLYISPVGFNSAIVPKEWRLLYSLNPMVGVIDGFRWALLGTGAPIYWPGVMISASLGMVLLASAIAHFRGMEKTFADEI